MYCVVNTTTKSISLTDLNIVIDSRQMLDLDKMNLPIPPEKSVHLEACRKNNSIKLMKSDRKSAKEDKGNNSQANMEDIKKFIREELSKISVPKKEESNNDILDAIRDIKNSIKSGVSSSNSNNVPDENTEEIDENISIKIHERAMMRLKGKTESNIEVEREVKEEKNTSKNIDDLMDLV